MQERDGERERQREREGEGEREMERKRERVRESLKYCVHTLISRTLLTLPSAGRSLPAPCLP